MKAVILAAGVGSRLNEITKSIPKSMIKINNTLNKHIKLQELQAYGLISLYISIKYYDYYSGNSGYILFFYTHTLLLVIGLYSCLEIILMISTSV